MTARYTHVNKSKSVGNNRGSLKKVALVFVTGHSTYSTVGSLCAK